MKKKTIVITRRQVLHGAGGITLALPFLPSLVPVRAWAADLALARQPAFVGIFTYNGGVLDTNVFPPDDVLTESTPLVPDHVIRRGKLVRRVEGTDAYFSRVLRAPATELTDRLVGKMNVLRGLDVPWGLGHTAGLFGNYADMPGVSMGLKPELVKPWPTIDQFIAWSPSFYKNTAGVRQRALYTGAGNPAHTSFFYSNPTSRSGPIQVIPQVQVPVKLFNTVFTGESTTPASAPGRPPIVDRVLESYRLMRNGSRRLSANDRRRLDDHMSRLAELQRQLKAVVPASAACGTVKAPSPDTNDGRGLLYDNASKFKRLLVQVDVVATALLCGYTRVVTLNIGESICSSSPLEQSTWHGDIVHAANEPPIAEAHQSVFRHVLLNLARKLDVEESPGVTCLDNALCMWIRESGEKTHDHHNIPVITFGAAGGSLRTGNYCDYRNIRDKSRIVQGLGNRTSGWTGLPWNQLLGTAVQAMGVPRSEYEKPGAYGYGEQYRHPAYAGTQAPGIWERSGELLPFLKA